MTIYVVFVNYVMDDDQLVAVYGTYDEALNEALELSKDPMSPHASVEAMEPRPGGGPYRLLRTDRVSQGYLRDAHSYKVEW